MPNAKLRKKSREKQPRGNQRWTLRWHPRSIRPTGSRFRPQSRNRADVASDAPLAGPIGPLARPHTSAGLGCPLLLALRRGAIAKATSATQAEPSSRPSAQERDKERGLPNLGTDPQPSASDARAAMQWRNHGQAEIEFSNGP
jgi:hypothetical protein